jgi:hypothetical protein
MTFEDYWDKLVKANPALRRGDCRMTIAAPAFKACLRRAFNHGKDDHGYDWVKEMFGGGFKH